MSQTYSTYYRYKDGSTGGGSGGVMLNSPSTTGEDLKQYFETPEDSSLWRRVGATDQTTGLYRLPTIAFNDYGVAIDYDDNTLETVWFKARGELSDLADALLLFPTNDLQTLPLAAQNGITVWWAEQVENITNAPTGLEGECEIFITTVGKFCQVTVKNNGGECYNYTHNLAAVPVVWSGWKYSTHMVAVAEAGKIFKATGPQTMGQADIYDFNDGTFSMGGEIRFPGAVFSANGRVGVHDALFPDDAVNLRTAQALLSSYVSSVVFAAYYEQLLLLISQANRVHGHEISDVNNLSGELDARLNKSLFLSGKPYWVAGRDSIGNPVMIDNKGAALNGQYMPDAVEGVAYNQTLARSLFVWPDNVYQIDLVKMSDKAWVRNGMVWDFVTGLTIAGTPPDDENPHIAVKMKWKFSENDEWKEQEFTIFLNVEASGTTITAPDAPSDLTATAEGTSVINVAWTDNSLTETGFRIYRRLLSGTLALIATVAAGVTAYRDTNLNSETRYYYKVEAYNSEGAALSNEANALTGTVAGGSEYIDEPVSGTSRIRPLSTTPPVVVPPVVIPGTNNTPRPVGQKFGFQPASFVETKEVIWQHKTTGQRRTFLQMDQNNNPNREKPDTNWFVAEVTDTEQFIKKTADAGCNYMDVWFRTPMLQTSATDYHFEILGRLLDYAASQQVYLSFGFKQDIGNGGLPEREGFGYDQSASWRFTAAQCEKSQRFGDEGGSTGTFYSAELSPCYLHLAVQNNLVNFYTAACNYLKNHANKAWLSSIHPIYSNTGESHFNINEDRYMGASTMTMQTFRTWLLNRPATVQGWFSTFISNHSNEGNSDARAFLRGYVDANMKAVWQWFLQSEYFIGYSGDINNGVYGRLSQVVRAAGFKFKRDDGSYTDFSVHRGNMYALAPNFISCFDTVKHNPAGSRVGYAEAAALKATGKEIGLEWTPGAIGSGEDFGSIAEAVGTITTACMDAWDAGADTQVLSFVIDNDYYNTVAIPIIQNLKNAGYWTLPKQTFTPPTVYDVSLYDQLAVGGWYANDSDGTPEPNEPIHRITTAVNGVGKNRANIQKYGFRILTVNDPTNVSTS